MIDCVASGHSVPPGPCSYLFSRRGFSPSSHLRWEVWLGYWPARRWRSSISLYLAPHLLRRSPGLAFCRGPRSSSSWFPSYLAFVLRIASGWAGVWTARFLNDTVFHIPEKEFHS